MSTLKDKYASVISTAESVGIRNLKVQEQDGILYLSGEALNTSQKDKVWDELGKIDATFTATDININIQIAELIIGSPLIVNTESSNLNIRQEPSTDSAVVAKAAKDETVYLLEQTSHDWWKIRTLNGEEGYVYTRYLKIN